MDAFNMSGGCLSLFDPAILPQKKASETVYLSKVFSSNIPVPLYDHIHDNVINKNICIFGKPKSGKTFLVYSLCLALKQKQYPIYLFSPTNTLRDNGFLPDFAHIQINGNLNDQLSKMIKEQTTLAMIHKSAQNIKEIEDFVMKQGMSEVVVQEAEKLKRYMWTQPPEKRAKYLEILIETIGNVVRKQNKKFDTPGDTMFAQMIGMGPPYVIFIFDDCGKVRNTSAYEDLSTNYRHKYISIINITQAQALIPRTLRLCSDVSVFCQLNYFTGALASNEITLTSQSTRWIDYAKEIFKQRFKFVVVNTSHTSHDTPIEYTASKYLASGSYYNISSTKVLEKIQKSTPTRRMWILQFLAYENQVIEKSK